MVHVVLHKSCPIKKYQLVPVNDCTSGKEWETRLQPAGCQRWLKSSPFGQKRLSPHTTSRHGRREATT
ncbi:hypothetical protein ANANG_G00095320 [Anguilla anguilla]|uniref:Uncharacterized protein n=1 Tax=Anguilla anguilla TaxID=7936 RepID=A0A9D3MFR0_ANGAN|nr:hypothetical protein ANANG_G00095320 [Anguilla anguilla]